MSTGVIFILGKGAARFWLQGSNQPGRRGHPRLGFPFSLVWGHLAYILLIMFLLISIKFANFVVFD